MKLEEIITVCAATGTGASKLGIIQSRLKGAKLDPESVKSRLDGHVPSGTIDKIQNILIHGKPELVESSKVDVSQLASKAEVAGFRAAAAEVKALVEAMGEKLEDMAKELAYAKSEREKLAAVVESLTAPAEAKK